VTTRAAPSGVFWQGVCGCTVGRPPGGTRRAASILHNDETIVIMEACKLSSKRWVATTACAA
jgi:hypothetical protein